MQQRQLRLGDILDDYCPRERRLTNHAIVAMIGPDVKQTRCTTCDAEHEYKHAKVPRQRRKAETPAALSSPALAGGPKRHEPSTAGPADSAANEPSDTASEGDASGTFEPEVLSAPAGAATEPSEPSAADGPGESNGDEAEGERDDREEEGPVHRPLIRASLPRPEGQPPPTRPNPEFTIRQPGGRQNRFRPRHGRGPQLHGNRSNGHMGGGPPRAGMPRHGTGRPPLTARLAKRRDPGRKRSK